LREVTKQGKLKAAVDSLGFRVDEVAHEHLPKLLAALIQVGDVASESGAVLAGQIPEYSHVRWAIFAFLSDFHRGIGRAFCWKSLDVCSHPKPW
jgi:hypothetical protein